MAAPAVVLGACLKGWVTEARCVHPTAGRGDEAGRAADCASVVRPWVANDTGGVPMFTKSQDEHGVLHSWANREYWTGFPWQGTSDGAAPFGALELYTPRAQHTLSSVSRLRRATKGTSTGRASLHSASTKH